MARYVRPKSLGTVFNNEKFFEANISTNANTISSSNFSTKKANVESLKISSSTTDSITLQDSLLQQNGDNLTISTDDGYILYLNKDKPTSGDVIINENSRNSNVVIENGTLFIRNGNLNVGNGSIMIDGALLDVVLRENQYQLSIQADNLANTTNRVQEQAVVIQDTVDVTVVNTSQIVSIQSSYAPLDTPVFTTNLTLPPIITANNVNVTDVQVSYLSNLSGDVQSGLNSLNTNLATVTSNQVTDRANISSLQTNLATVTSNQVTDKANISSRLQTNLATVTSKQVTDEANISGLQSVVQTKANIVSPTFSGEPRVPTANPISNNTVIANTQYVDLAISSLVGSSPDLLNTLQEINVAINNDPSFAATVANQISLKANINNPTFTNGLSTPAINLNGTDLQTSLNTFALSSTLSNYLLSSTASSTYALITSLSNYVTNSALATTLSSHITSSSLATTLSSYALTSTLSSYALVSSLSEYLTIANASSTYQTISGMSSYLTTSNASLTYQTISGMTSYLTTALAAATYVTATSLSTTLSSYVTSSSLTSTLASYVTSSSLTTTLSSYVLSSALSSYALASSLSSYVTSSSLTSTLTSYVTSSSLTTTLSSYALSSALSSYALASSLSSYVTSSSLTSTLASYVTSSSLTTTLSSYALSSALSSYITSATAASTYGTLTALSNILNGTTSFTGITNSGITNLNGMTNILRLSDTLSSVAVASGSAACNYNNGAVFVITGQTANFTLALSNLTPVANKTYSVTLLISSASSKFYANALTVNGTSTTFIYNGGSAAISVSSATYIIQQFNLVYTASTSAPAFVISSIGQAF